MRANRRMENAMKYRTLLAIGLMMSALTACWDGLLDVQPADRLTEDLAIADARGARAALAGAYQAMQSTSYYGGTFVFFNDLSADNAVHTGTFNSHFDAARNELRPDNTAVAGIWSAIYDAINRANHLIDKVPGVPDLDPAERDRILGEAHFLRALHYHNLVRLWDDVPIRTSPIESVEEASQIARSPVSEVYSQILNDLAEAQARLSAGGDTRRASLGAALALEARVHFYLGDWPATEAAVEAVEGLGYDLADDYGSLFPATDGNTPEDIFRVLFTAVQWNQLGWYYISSAAGGRGEIAPQQELIDAYEAGDVRQDVSISGDVEGAAWGIKYPTTIGAEHPHVIRYGEIVLINAEVLARQDLLEEAVDEYNRIRERAGLAPHTLGAEVTTQAEVLEAIWHERRLELAFEGDRFSDLNRTGRAVEVLGIPEYQSRFPIPQSELDVAPNMTQNPGY
jgi:starch-binding outer membrane protein, SusD/RagB family